jgi:hypothetical protein
MHLAIGLALKAVEMGHRIYFLTLHDLVTKSRVAREKNRLEVLLRTLTRAKLLALAEIGYLPLEQPDATFLFEVVNKRYQEPKSMFLTSNKSFGQWDEIFPDPVLATALLDRLLHPRHHEHPRRRLPTAASQAWDRYPTMGLGTWFDVRPVLYGSTLLLAAFIVRITIIKIWLNPPYKKALRLWREQPGAPKGRWLRKWSEACFFGTHHEVCPAMGQARTVPLRRVSMRGEGRQ